MTLITDAKNLIDHCQRIEESIYDIVFSYHSQEGNIDTIKYQMKHVPEVVKEGHTMIKALLIHEPISEIVTLRKNLGRLLIRLEAAIMYAKNYFKID
jgi:hypothetical protein